MTTPCLSPHDLESLLADQLPEPRRTVAADHLATCPDCQSAAEELIAALLPEPVPARALWAAPPDADGEDLATFLKQLKELPPPEVREPDTATTLLETPFPGSGSMSDTEADASVGESLRDPHPDAADVLNSQRSRPRSDRTTPDPDPSLGTTIGLYTLTAELGHGGFGIVYQAEQQRPIRRTVALKLIKLGMDSREIIARFDAERQALALMDHPNIARILDAGTTGRDEGRGSRVQRNETLDSRPSTLPSTLNPQPSTLNPQPSTLIPAAPTS